MAGRDEEKSESVSIARELLGWLFYILIIIGFFVFFPQLMAEKTYLIAVLIYFMCPTGFALPMQISPLYKKEEDSSFTSAFISLYMIITLIVYTIIVIFIV